MRRIRLSVGKKGKPIQICFNRMGGGAYLARKQVRRSPSSQSGTRAFGNHQAASIPPRRSTQPHPQRTHSPATKGKVEFTMKPTCQRLSPTSRQSLPLSLLSQRVPGSEAVTSVCPQGPTDHSVQHSARTGRWTDGVLVTFLLLSRDTMTKALTEPRVSWGLTMQRVSP